MGKINKPTQNDIKHFQSILSQPDRNILTTHEDVSPYNKDWTNHYTGSSSLVLRPKSTNEVSAILRYCNENFIGIVPQGGNTSLCGGATPIQEEVILSLENMNTIYSIDEHSGILTCDSGVILQNLQEYANEHNYLFPLDIGAKGTCQIGGNVSTNAGGQYFFRFGSLHSSVLGMEVVLANGSVLKLNMNDTNDTDDTIQQSREKKKRYCGTNRKDNTGYDLKHLFIGAEGTLGIITKVAVACPALPSSRNATLLVCDSYENVLKVLQCAKEELGEILSALELMDYNTLQLVQKHGFGSSDDGDSGLLNDMLQSEENIDSSSTTQPLFILVETQGSNFDHDASKMDSFLSRLFDTNTIQNGFLAQDTKQLMEMWNIREACNPSVALAGCVYKFDVSVPIEEYIDLAKEVEMTLMTQLPTLSLDVCVWGHVADGNAHINIVTPGQYKKDTALAKHIETIVYDSVLKRSGSISAEHGIGQSKKEYLGHIKDDNVLNIMKQMKMMFDPHGIMNPNKYLPHSIS